MAVAARSAELSAVDVFVARRTDCGRTAITAGMALPAWNALVLSGQRELGLLVIEQHRREFRRIDRVAIGTLRKLPRMDIAMTTRAFNRKVSIDPCWRSSLVALLAAQRRMLSLEELREARMFVPSNPERIGRVTLLTRSPELALVRIGVTG